MNEEELVAYRESAIRLRSGQTKVAQLAADILDGAIAHIDQQQATIETLKTALISERNRYLVDFIHEYDEVRDCREEATSQLAREMPEIFGDIK